MKRLLIAAFLLLAQAGVASAATPILTPDGVLRYPLAGRVTIACAPLSACDIAFEPGERIVIDGGLPSIFSGDNVRWSISRSESGPGGLVEHILVKPLDRGLSTNLVVNTTRRTYDILLKADEGARQHLYGFIYPTPVSVVRPLDQQGRDSLPSTDVPPSPKRGCEALAIPLGEIGFAWKIQPTSAKQPVPLFRPVAVFDDGHRTYFKLPHRLQTLPVLYADANDAVNFTTVDACEADTQWIVADRIAASFTLTGDDQSKVVITRARE